MQCLRQDKVKARNMSGDSEIQAMTSISEILERLEDEAAKRVVRWAADRFGVGSVGSGVHATFRSGSPAAHGSSPSPSESLPELFAAVNASSQPEKALVTGYWFQQILGQEDFDAQQVNAELKQLGHGITNITRALGELMTQRPQLAIQTRKSGKSKQARKRYKITGEGIRAVDRMMLRNPEAAGSSAPS